MTTTSQSQSRELRPYQLLCLVCALGEGPAEPTNARLADVCAAIRANPELPVTLRGNAGDVFAFQDPGTAEDTPEGADWLMCAPCPSRVVSQNACVCGPLGSGGLYNEFKDLNLLQRLGLTFGATLPANRLLRLMFERVPAAAGVCALRNGVNPPESLWWDPCGANQAPENYAKGRELLLARLAG